MSNGYSAKVGLWLHVLGRRRDLASVGAGNATLRQPVDFGPGELGVLEVAIDAKTTYEHVQIVCVSGNEVSFKKIEYGWGK